MKRYLLGLFLFSGLLCLFSCRGSGNIIRFDAAGDEGQLLIVIDQEVWESRVGDSLQEYFSREYPGLPQQEPMFEVYKVFPGNFNKTFQRFKNILIINVDPALKENSIEKGYDEWANGQAVVRLSAPSTATVLNAFRSKRADIAKFFHEEDIKRVIKSLNRIGEDAISAELQKKFGFTLQVPQGYIPTAGDSNTWVALMEGLKKADGLEYQIIRGVWVTTFPYTDPQTFTLGYMIAKRDSLARKHLWGEDSTQHIAIDTINVPVDSTSITLEGEYAMETRGLWTMENGFMGGPFLNYMFLNPGKNKVIMIEAFVFAPRFDKKEYMIQMEGLLRTFDFPEEEDL